MPKKVLRCGVLSGHVSKRCMTVIGRWGAIVTRTFRRLIFAWAASLLYYYTTKNGGRDMSVFTGAGVAIVTPFHEDFSINYEAFAELIEYQIANSTDAIIVMGTTESSSNRH